MDQEQEVARRVEEIRARYDEELKEVNARHDKKMFMCDIIGWSVIGLWTLYLVWIGIIALASSERHYDIPPGYTIQKNLVTETYRWVCADATSKVEFISLNDANKYARWNVSDRTWGGVDKWHHFDDRWANVASNVAEKVEK